MGTFLLGPCNLHVTYCLVTVKVLATAFTQYYCAQIITKELFKQWLIGVLYRWFLTKEDN